LEQGRAKGRAVRPVASISVEHDDRSTGRFRRVGEPATQAQSIRRFKRDVLGSREGRRRGWDSLPQGEVDMSTNSQVAGSPSQIPEPPLARFLFADTRMDEGSHARHRVMRSLARSG